MEWPLVFFTIFSQIACGAFLTFAFLQWRKPEVLKNEHQFFSLCILAMTGLSVFAAMFHLGKPYFAYRMLYHFQTSWLSREIWIFAIFGALNFFYSAALYFKKKEIAIKIFWITAVVGFFGVIVTSMIYKLPSHPAWDNLYTPISFIFTEFIAGPLYFAALMQFRKLEVSPKLYEFVFTMIGANTIAFIVYLTTIAKGHPAAVATYENIVCDPLLYARLVIEVIFPLAYWAYCFCRHQEISKKMFYLLVVAIITGEFFGRIIFYFDVVMVYTFNVLNAILN